jgi:hypothetical protein
MEVAYPIFPVLSLFSAALLVVVLIIRKSWNFGVYLLCITTLLLDIIYGINAIIWANDADIKAVAWCDIGSSI